MIYLFLQAVYAYLPCAWHGELQKSTEDAKVVKEIGSRSLNLSTV